MGCTEISGVAALPDEVEERVLGAEFAIGYMGHVRLVILPCQPTANHFCERTTKEWAGRRPTTYICSGDIRLGTTFDCHWGRGENAYSPPPKIVQRSCGRRCVE